jgi:hypothetical protein
LFLHLGKEAFFGGYFFTGSVMVPEGAPESFIHFPYFYEREGFCDGIPDGGVGDGWWVAGFVFHSGPSQDGSQWTFIVKVASGCCSWATIRAASTMRCVSCEDWSWSWV